MNRQLLNLQPSPTLVLNQKAKALKASGQKVYNFTAGEPDGDTPEAIRQAAIEAIGSKKNKYTESAGILPLRQAIANKAKRIYGREYAPSEVIVSTGGKQAIFNALYGLLNPEDEVILLTPSWVSYKSMVQMLGSKPVEVFAGIESQFVPTVEAIEKAITPQTKLIILNSPCNPSGAVYSKQFIQDLSQLLIKHENIFVLTDDIYEHFVFEGEFSSFAMELDFPKERLIIANGVSKSHAMTGWRIGYALASKGIISVMNKIQSQVTSNACSIAQYAALSAIESEAETINPFKASFLERRNLIFDELSKMDGLKVILPKGAFYIFPNVEGLYGIAPGDYTIASDLDLCAYLLDQHGIAVVPGTAFESPGYIRLSYGMDPQEIKEGMKKLQEALSQIQKKKV